MSEIVPNEGFRGGQGHDQSGWEWRWAQKHELIRRSFFCTPFGADKLELVEKEVYKLMILECDVFI